MDSLSEGSVALTTSAWHQGNCQTPFLCCLLGNSGPTQVLSGNGQDPWTGVEGPQPLGHPLPAGAPAGIRAPTENELRQDLLSFPRNVAELGSLQTRGGDVSMLNPSGHREPR